jgi:hypothetical protein
MKLYEAIKDSRRPSRPSAIHMARVNLRRMIIREDPLKVSVIDILSSFIWYEPCGLAGKVALKMAHAAAVGNGARDTR